MKFKTEQDAIDWVELNIPFLVKQKRSVKYTNPFNSGHAFRQVVDILAKELYKLTNNQ